MNKKKSAPWLQALHAVMPLCISYIPVGLACGVLLQKVGFDPLLSGLLSILVFSGGAQFLVASMLTTQASFATTLLMVFFLELRYTLLGASLAGFMKKEKRTFLAVFSQSLNDENYAVNYLKFSTDPSWNKRKALYVNWFSMAAWAGSNMIGNFFGSVIRVDADLVHFALTAMFIFHVCHANEKRTTDLYRFVFRCIRGDLHGIIPKHIRLDCSYCYCFICRIYVGEGI